MFTVINIVDKDKPIIVNVFRWFLFLIDWDKAIPAKIKRGVKVSHSYSLNTPSVNKDTPIKELNNIEINKINFILLRFSRSFNEIPEINIDKENISKLKELKKNTWERVNIKKVIVDINEVIIDMLIAFFNLLLLII